MSAALQWDESAPLEGAAVNAVQAGPVEPYTALATVTEISPGSVEDTQPIPRAEAESQPEPEPEPEPIFTKVPSPVVAARPAPVPTTLIFTPVKSQPKPERKPSPAPAPAPVPAPAPAPDPAPDPGPELVRQEENKGKPVFAGSRHFSKVYKLGIGIGAVGQIAGFGTMFGAPAATGMTMIGLYAAAAVVGIGFELIMVTFGDRALEMRASGYRVRQWIPFLLISAAAAGVASLMNLDHWKPLHITLAAIFAGVAMLGYLGHMFDGFVQVTHYRAELAKQELAAEARQQEAEAKLRQQAEEAKQREAEEARRRNLADANAEMINRANDILAQTRKRKTEIKRADGVALGVNAEITKPADLRNYLAELHFTPPTRDTLKAWTRDIRKHLEVADDTDD